MPEAQNQDAAALSAQFVEACFDFQVPATRAAAEAVLTSFRQIPNVLPLFKYILDHARDPSIQEEQPMTQFQAALAISNIVARDFTLYALNDLIQLKDYMIQYCLERPLLKKFVRDQLLLAVSLIMKRSLFDIPEHNRKNFLTAVAQLLAVGSDCAAELAMALGCALIDQFSSTKSTTVGLCWEFHHNCKVFYESHLLLPTFQSALSQLHIILEQRPCVQDSSSSFLVEILNLAEKTLHWDFETPNSSPTLAQSFDRLKSHEESSSEEGPSSRKKLHVVFPIEWRSVVADGQVLELFFKTYSLVRENVTLGHPCGECLVQLAGLRGDFFGNDQNAVNIYSTTMIKGILNMMNEIPDAGYATEVMMGQGPQLLRTIQMIRRVLENIPLVTLFAVPQLFEFLNGIRKLTMDCLKGTVDDVDEDWISTACDESLQTWTYLADIVQPVYYGASNPKAELSPEQAQYLTQYMRSAAYEIVECFIKTCLERAKLVLDDIDEEDEIGNGFKDYDTFSDQLTCIGILGRLNPQQSLMYLQHLLGEMFKQLQVYFTTRVTESDQQLVLLFEGLHWIILIAAHILADSGKGEQPMIPNSLMQLSGSQSFEQDLVVNLSNQFLEVFSFTSSFSPNSVEASNLSPRVIETLVWYLDRWSKSYLLIDEGDYGYVSPNIIKAFGRPSTSGGQGIHVVDFFIEKMKANFILWNADPDVLLQFVKWLNTCGLSSNLMRGFLMSERFRELIEFVTRSLEQLPEVVHNSLVQAIMSIASGANDRSMRDRYFQLMFNTIEERLLTVIRRPDLQSSTQDVQVVNGVQNALEMFDGLALASSYNNTVQILEFCSRFFESFLQLMNMYRNVEAIQLAILQLFADLAGQLEFSVLEIEQKQILFQNIAKLLEIFRKTNSGRKRVHRQEEMQDQPYADISTVLVLLSNIMASEFEDFDRQCASLNDTANSVDVVLIGVNVVIPMIDMEMLKIPDICQRYIQLVSHIVEVFPNKLVTLPKNLFNGLMASLEYGIDHDIVTVNIMTWRAVTPLAKWVHNQQSNQAVNDFFAPFLSKFLWMLLNMLLFGQLDSHVIDAASEALLSLICAQRATYTNMVRETLGHQPADIQPRLLKAFEELDKAVPKQEVPGMSRATTKFKDALMTLLVNVRAVLRVK